MHSLEGSLVKDWDDSVRIMNTLLMMVDKRWGERRKWWREKAGEVREESGCWSEWNYGESEAFGCWSEWKDCMREDRCKSNWTMETLKSGVNSQLLNARTIITCFPSSEWDRQPPPVSVQQPCQTNQRILDTFPGPVFTEILKYVISS